MLEIRHVVNFGGALWTLNMLGVGEDLGVFLLSGRPSASWVLAYVISLSYCRATAGLKRAE